MTVIAGMFLSFGVLAEWDPTTWSVELVCKVSKAGDGTTAISGTIAWADATHADSIGAGTLLGEVIQGASDSNIADLGIPCTVAEAIINANITAGEPCSADPLTQILSKFYLSPTTTFPVGSSGVVITRWNAFCDIED